MFQIDEKVLADSRTLITVQKKKDQVDSLTKNGTLHYTLEGNNLWLATPKVRTAYMSRQNYLDVYDKVVLARNGKDIDGIYSFDNAITFKDNVEIKKDLLIKGNLTVEGNASIIDTPRLSIEDNIIELNRNEVGNGITFKNAGVAVNRGTKGFARTIYNEDNKAFIFDTAENMDEAFNAEKWVVMAYSEANGDYVAGELRAKQRLTAPFGKFTDSITVSNQSTLNNLKVEGNSVFSGSVNHNGSTTTNGEFISNGVATFNELFTANKVAAFNDNVTMAKTLSVTGMSTFMDKTTHKKGLVVETLGANITGASAINGILDVSDNASFKKDLYVEAKVLSNELETVDAAKLYSLGVTTTSIFNGPTDVKSTLSVVDKTTLNNTSIEGMLTVNSTSTFIGDVTISNKNLVINSNSENNGTIVVGGNAYFKKTLDVDGDANFDSNVEITGSLLMETSDILARNITAKNDLKIEAGEGKGLKFWDSDDHKIYMSASTTSELGGKLDSTSDYNMYFKMNGGINRGFVFKSGNTPVAQIESNGQIRTNGKVIIKGYAALTTNDQGHKTDNSGINADRLDDLHSTDFLRRNIDTGTNAKIVFNTDGKAIEFSSGGSIYKDGAVTVKTGDAINSGFKILTEADADLLVVKDNISTGILFKGNKVWHSGNDGAGSGMDADTLDGSHKSDFATATHNHDDVYIKNNEIDLKQKYKIQYNSENDSLDFIYVG